MDLYQDRLWEDEDGNKILIASMPPHHAYNCARWLESHAKDIAFVDSAKWIGLGSWVRGEQALLDLDWAMEQDEREKDDPVAWIQGLPLWEALDQRGREKVEPTLQNFFG
jgi:hypothetical protein